MFHAWVDPTAPSRLPPLSEPSWAHVVPGSEPAPSSSRSSASAKKPCTARKPFYLTPVQREKVQLDKNEKDNARTKMVKKLTQEAQMDKDALRTAYENTLPLAERRDDTLPLAERETQQAANPIP